MSKVQALMSKVKQLTAKCVSGADMSKQIFIMRQIMMQQEVTRRMAAPKQCPTPAGRTFCNSFCDNQLARFPGAGGGVGADMSAPGNHPRKLGPKPAASMPGVPRGAGCRFPGGS